MSVVPRRGRVRRALRPEATTIPRRALVARHALEPARALSADWRSHGRRLGRRVGLILGVALIGGPLAYIVLPQSVAAQPGGPHNAPSATSVAAPVRQPAVVAGLIDGGDLLANPVGVVTTGPTVAAGGELIGWPVTDHTPSTGFGYRSDPFTHRQRWHDGVDLGQPCGDPAWASLGGTVADAGWAGGYGNRVVIRHADRDGHTFATTYNHMARIEVQVGQQVTRGQVVGRIGSTGRSTACHMHFEVILDGYYVDPMRFLTGDQSKAALSRRVGSYMPAGQPSANPTLTFTPSPSRSTASPSPTHSTPTPTPTPSNSRTPTPSPTTPSPTPTPTTQKPSPTGTAATQTPGVTGPESPASTASAAGMAPTGPAPSSAAATPHAGNAPTLATAGPAPTR